MRTSLAVAGVAAALALTFAVPAHADVVTTIPLAERHAPASAAGSGVRDCAALGARRGVDTWQFALRSDRFDFTTVTARFGPRRDSRVATFVATAPGSRVTAAGKRATLTAPPGLWLIGASAVVHGTGRRPTEFTVARTCVAVVARPAPDRVTAPAPPPTTARPTATPSVPAESLPSAAPSESEEAVVVSPSPSVESDTVVTRRSNGTGIPPLAMALVAMLLAAGLVASVGVLFRAVGRRPSTAA